MNNWLTSDNPLIIAHRGASADAPENTMQAFQLAVAQGAAGFEFDVQLSADGQPVIIHDQRVDRVTNGRGVVSDMTVAELQTLQVEGGEKIPTLAELFETFGDTVLFNIEVKNWDWRDGGTETAVGRLIKQYGLAQNCLVSSFNPISLRRGKAVISAEALFGLIRFDAPQKFGYHLFSGEADHPHYWLVNSHYMHWANKRGYRIHVWTVDDPAVAQRLVTAGVHGLITNKPQFLREQLNL